MRRTHSDAVDAPNGIALVAGGVSEAGVLSESADSASVLNADVSDPLTVGETADASLNALSYDVSASEVLVAMDTTDATPIGRAMTDRSYVELRNARVSLGSRSHARAPVGDRLSISTTPQRWYPVRRSPSRASRCLMTLHAS
jgi:hypothetical protein